MKLINIRLLVSDFATSVAFWRDVIHLPLKYHYEEMRYAYFETGTAGLELMAHDDFTNFLGEKMPVPASMGRQSILVFQVEDVDSSYADLVARGAQAVTPPQDHPEVGVRSAHVGDPDGNLIELYNHLQA